MKQWILMLALLALLLAGCGGEGGSQAAPAIPPEYADAEQTGSGLGYVVLREGTGPRPQVGDVVYVHYRGRLLDGTEFDSSYKRGDVFSFMVGTGQVISGWDEGLLLMNEGGKMALIIPPELAYGEAGSPPTIPPNATLIFEVELVSIGE